MDHIILFGLLSAHVHFCAMFLFQFGVMLPRSLACIASLDNALRSGMHPAETLFASFSVNFAKASVII